MGFNNKTYKALKNLTMLTQLALSLLTPTLLCIFGAVDCDAGHISGARQRSAKRIYFRQTIYERGG